MVWPLVVGAMDVLFGEAFCLTVIKELRLMICEFLLCVAPSFAVDRRSEYMQLDERMQTVTRLSTHRRFEWKAALAAQRVCDLFRPSWRVILLSTGGSLTGAFLGVAFETEYGQRFCGRLASDLLSNPVNRRYVCVDFRYRGDRLEFEARADGSAWSYVFCDAESPLESRPMVQFRYHGLSATFAVCSD